MSAATSPMTQSERRTYSGMADTMNHFHNHFKRTYHILLAATQPMDNPNDEDTRPRGMPLSSLLTTTSDFIHHLTLHHSIEEAHVFPLLAERMPAFRPSDQLLTQHELIHQGLDKLEAYVRDCRRGKRTWTRGEMRALLEGFGAVLMAHLDEEVRGLGAEEMRKAWSLEEMRRMPM